VRLGGICYHISATFDFHYRYSLQGVPSENGEVCIVVESDHEECIYTRTRDNFSRFKIRCHFRQDFFNIAFERVELFNKFNIIIVISH
jgi:hypothetical protein